MNFTTNRPAIHIPRQKTLLQGFEWYLPADQSHWKRMASEAKALRKAGFTSIWLPPAYKGSAGREDVGYGVYDLYDLGEFDQKGTIATKYGTKEEYLAAIQALQGEGLEVLADIVLNHKMGADYFERVQATPCAHWNRNESAGEHDIISAWTGFTFPGRKGTYSTFRWNHKHFCGVDWDDRHKQSQIYRLAGKEWDEEVDRENGNFDYLMGADIDVSNPEVVEELDKWGEWYLKTTGANGLRLDAVKHIKFTFFSHWLEEMRKRTGKELWTVGEYWNGDLPSLTNYLDKSGNIMNLFDVPLHFRFAEAANSGRNFDLRTIFQGTLVGTRPQRAVTFVDNHDTQPGQALSSWVQDWFRPLAYALILLRQEGTPCVFYGDRYGMPHCEIKPMGSVLDKLLLARQERAWGEQTDYFDEFNMVGWTRAGDELHEGSGLAVLLSNGPAGKKTMCMGLPFAGKTFVDLLGNCAEQVVIGPNGCGAFPVEASSVSVWVPEETLAQEKAPCEEGEALSVFDPPSP